MTVKLEPFHKKTLNGIPDLINSTVKSFHLGKYIVAEHIDKNPVNPFIPRI